MTGDKDTFTKLEDWNGGLVRFGDNSSTEIKGEGTLSIDGKLLARDLYYVEGLKHNFLVLVRCVKMGTNSHLILKVVKLGEKKMEGLWLKVKELIEMCMI